ncbi:MAG TPA: YwiC-like family protein, partial [Blastocatellia bacterium]|nr:YwiC-like family protein [Blastocatellia bacterium]
MKLSKTLRLPKEHGAWAMLYVPFVVGALVAGRFQLSLLFLLLATTAVFISRESLIVWLRARSRGRDANGANRMAIIYLTLASLFGLPLLFFYKLYWLVP